MVPLVVSDGAMALLPADSVIPLIVRAGRPASSTLVPAWPATGTVTVGVWSPMEMVSVVTDVSVSPSFSV